MASDAQSPPPARLSPHPLPCRFTLMNDSLRLVLACVMNEALRQGAEEPRACPLCFLSGAFWSFLPFRLSLFFIFVYLQAVASLSFHGSRGFRVFGLLGQWLLAKTAPLLHTFGPNGPQLRPSAMICTDTRRSRRSEKVRVAELLDT